MSIKHKHHIIPKHAGGTDDITNIVELSIEEHAEAHKKLYDEHGRWQDLVAWQTLSGQIKQAEAIKLSQKNADKSWMKTDKGKEILSKRWDKRKLNGFTIWNKGLTKDTSEGLRKLSAINKEHRKLGKLSNIGDVMRGKKRTEAHKQNLSASLRNIKPIRCPHCGKEAKPGMYSRWHGDRCKHRKL